MKYLNANNVTLLTPEAQDLAQFLAAALWSASDAALAGVTVSRFSEALVYGRWVRETAKAMAAADTGSSGGFSAIGHRWSAVTDALPVRGPSRTRVETILRLVGDFRDAEYGEEMRARENEFLFT